MILINEPGLRTRAMQALDHFHEESGCQPQLAAQKLAIPH